MGAACRADIDGGRAVFEEKALSRNIWQQGFECCQRGLPAPGTSGSGIYLRGSNVGPGKLPRYRCHLGCILLKMTAMSLRTNDRPADHQ